MNLETSFDSDKQEKKRDKSFIGMACFKKLLNFLLGFLAEIPISHQHWL